MIAGLHFNTGNLDKGAYNRSGKDNYRKEDNDKY